jgi:two-component system sensor histidine kinase UhpB
LSVSKVDASDGETTTTSRARQAFQGQQQTLKGRGSLKMHRSWEEMSSLPVAYALLSPEGQFLRVNQAACELFGYPESVLLSLKARDITHPEDRAQSVALVERALRHREEGHQVIKRYLHSEGHVIWALLSTRLEKDHNNQPTGWVSRIEDITDRVEGDDVVRGFVRRIQMVKEQERQSIARELHEELGQTFTGLKLELDKLHQMLPAETRTHAARLASVVDDTLASVRRFTAALRPPILDDLGLESALEWLLAKFCQGAGIAWSFPRRGKPLSLDWETRIALFRIAQEGLNHVIRHSGARRVELRLGLDGDWVVLTIADDGKGPLPSADLENGLEIYIMRERAEVMGGQVLLRPNQPRGTVVEARLRAPLEKSSWRELNAYWE